MIIKDTLNFFIGFILFYFCLYYSTARALFQPKTKRPVDKSFCFFWISKT